MHRLRLAAVGVALNLAACNGPTPASHTARAGVVNDWRPIWGETADAKLRPGALLDASACTANFLFVDPVRQLYYLGTAGHCTFGADGANEDGTGTRVALDGFGEIGTVVLDTDATSFNGEDGRVDIDFSLIALDPDINLVANPQMLGFMGPTGYMDCADASAGDLIDFYGHGSAFETIGSLYSREGVYLRCVVDTWEVAVPVTFGDSGGPLLHAASGKAFGFASSGAGTLMFGPTMSLIFSALSATGFGDVALATIDGGYVAPPSPGNQGK